MKTPEALEIVLKMARAHLAFTADLADNFDMNSSDNRPFNTLEAEAIEEVELLSKSYEMYENRSKSSHGQRNIFEAKWNK
jgi:hypothetical protein